MPAAVGSFQMFNLRLLCDESEPELEMYNPQTLLQPPEFCCCLRPSPLRQQLCLQMMITTFYRCPAGLHSRHLSAETPHSGLCWPPSIQAGWQEPSDCGPCTVKDICVVVSWFMPCLFIQFYLLDMSGSSSGSVLAGMTQDC